MIIVLCLFIVILVFFGCNEVVVGWWLEVINSVFIVSWVCLLCICIWFLWWLICFIWVLRIILMFWLCKIVVILLVIFWFFWGKNSEVVFKMVILLLKLANIEANLTLIYSLFKIFKCLGNFFRLSNSVLLYIFGVVVILGIGGIMVCVLVLIKIFLLWIFRFFLGWWICRLWLLINFVWLLIMLILGIFVRLWKFLLRKKLIILFLRCMVRIKFVCCCVLWINVLVGM